MKGKNMTKEGKNRSVIYLVLAIVIAVIALASVITILIVANNQALPVTNTELSNNDNSTEQPKDNQDTIIQEDPIVPISTTIRFSSPIEEGEVSNTYGFFHNNTLNWYYLHTGIDFSCEAGTQLKSAYAGTVESIVTDDILLSSQITIDHGNGLKTSYTYVDPIESLQVGDAVAQGQTIGFVAEASGDEYLDGSHLHFEVVKNNETIDPELYLEISEK